MKKLSNKDLLKQIQENLNKKETRICNHIYESFIDINAFKSKGINFDMSGFCLSICRIHVNLIPSHFNKHLA